MATSRFNYISTTELAAFIHTMSGVTDAALAATFINDAEVIIDAYVGPQRKFLDFDLSGSAKSLVASGSATFTATVFGDRRPNYWAKGGTYVEMLEGVTLGQTRLIVASTTGGVVTLVSGFDGIVSAGEDFNIHQRSKFPRWNDCDPFGTPRMPDELKQAVAWQVEYGIHFGSEEFGLGDTNVSTNEAASVQSRTYGSGYSETRIPGQERGMARFIAPKARIILRELLNSTGHL